MCRFAQGGFMDTIDKQILSLLAENARMPVKEIADRVALTSPAVSGRIRKMEQDGIIDGYTVVLRPQSSKTQVNALVSLSLHPSDRPLFLDMIGQMPQVRQCYHVTGSHSFIVKVCCQDMDQLEHLINRFQKLGQTSTQIILSTLLDRRAPQWEL